MKFQNSPFGSLVRTLLVLAVLVCAAPGCSTISKVALCDLSDCKADSRLNGDWLVVQREQHILIARIHVKEDGPTRHLASFEIISPKNEKSSISFYVYPTKIDSETYLNIRPLPGQGKKFELKDSWVLLRYSYEDKVVKGFAFVSAALRKAVIRQQIAGEFEGEDRIILKATRDELIAFLKAQRTTSMLEELDAFLVREELKSKFVD